MHLFESQGYFATTIEAITTEAGVSKGLVYNYFASKEALLVAMVEGSTEAMATLGGNLTPGGSLDESLSTFVDSFFGFLTRERRNLKLQLTLMLMPELRDVIGESQRRRAELLLAVVRSWLKRAGVSQPKHRARLLLAMLDGIALHYLSIYERYPLAAMRPFVLRGAMSICTQTEKGSDDAC